MEMLIGSHAIAKYLGISKSHLWCLRKQYHGKKHHPPIASRVFGRPPERRRKLWTMDNWIAEWFYQISYLEEQEKARNKR
jgi:hypothetical protein